MRMRSPGITSLLLPATPLAVPRRQIVLASSQDKFFQAHMHENFGDLGMAVKSLIDKYSAAKGSHATVKSIGEGEGQLGSQGP